MERREHWEQLAAYDADTFLRAGVEGRDHPSRRTVVELLDGMRSVLDVGCGTGVMFDLIRDLRPDLDYTGIDLTEKFIQAARARFPAEASRFRHCSLYDLPDLDQTFDAVLARHILEHLPDYVPATQQMYARTEHKLILVFYLPPRPLGSERKHDERFEENFYTHTYDLGTLVDHLLNELAPPPSSLRIYPRQGGSDPSQPWGDRQNIIYEVIRPAGAGR